MKTLIVYQSKYGSTKQYAEWLAAELSADIFALSELDSKKLADYDLVVFGSYLYIGRIVASKFLTVNWPILKDKKVILFSVSAACPGSPDLIAYYQNSVPEHIRESIKHFELWGRYSQLDFGDSILMVFPRTVLKVKAWLSGKEEDRRSAQESFRPFDEVRRESIRPIVEYIKNLK